MAHYVIGDVHGCYLELIHLLKVINFNPTKDTLWFTGDLVNRGPASLEVLRLIKNLASKAVVVLGNHDLHLLQCLYTTSKGTNTHEKELKPILLSPDRQELGYWLRHRPLMYYNAQWEAVLVHAGLFPRWNLQQAIDYAQEVAFALQSNHYIDFLRKLSKDQPTCWDDQLTGWNRLCFITKCFTRMRFCNHKGALIKGKDYAASENFLPWFKIQNPLKERLQIFFGHWSNLKGQTHEPNIYALDTGCVWGGDLTALRLEDHQRFTVPSSFSYNQLLQVKE